MPRKLSHYDGSGRAGMVDVSAKAPSKRDMREGAYRGMYLGGDESLTSRSWVDAHVRKGRGHQPQVSLRSQNDRLVDETTPDMLPYERQSRRLG